MKLLCRTSKGPKLLQKKVNSTDKSEALQYLVSTELTQANIESEAEPIKGAKSSHCTSEELQTGKLK